MKQNNQIEKSDKQLMLLVRDGKLDALGLLFQRYHIELYNFLHKLTNDAALSNDILQMTFERILRGKHTFRDSTPFRPWMFCIAKNTLSEHYSRGAWRHVQSITKAEYKLQTPEKVAKDEVLQMALSKLRPEQTEVLLLTRYEGLKCAEVAEILGISETGVRSRVHRALKSLKEEYFKIERNEA